MSSLAVTTVDLARIHGGAAASPHYALAVTPVAALILTPVLLLDKGRTHVFHARVGGEQPAAPGTTVARESGGTA